MPPVEADVGAIPISRVSWHPSVRIIPTRFLPIDLFERIADPRDWEALIEVESLTNDRLRQEAGLIQLVPHEDRVSGPAASWIMAPFTHLTPGGGRFTDGTHGAYYAAGDRETAVAETRYHRERFMSATEEPAMELDMRVLYADLEGDLQDIRGMKDTLSSIYAPDSYTDSQRLGRELRSAGSDGLVFDSVRHVGGECVAVFRPRLLSNCREVEHLCYVWDGEKISWVYEKRFPT